MEVPWWSLPALVATLVSIWAFRNSGRAVTAAGLSGSKVKTGAVRRGQSARSVAEMAANAAIAMQTQVELQETKIATLEKTIEGQNDTIALLRKDNDRLERLVNRTDWGQSLIQQIAANHTEFMAASASEHAEVMSAIASIGAGK